MPKNVGKTLILKISCAQLNCREFDPKFVPLYVTTQLSQVTMAFLLILTSRKVFRRGVANCIKNQLLYVAIELLKRRFQFAVIDSNPSALKSTTNFFYGVHSPRNSTSSIGRNIDFNFDKDHVVIGLYKLLLLLAENTFINGALKSVINCSSSVCSLKNSTISIGRRNDISMPTILSIFKCLILTSSIFPTNCLLHCLTEGDITSGEKSVTTQLF